MSFARDVRNTTPVRKGHNVKPAAAAERPEQSIGRLLDIVTDHGLQLKSLRQEHEALQQETKALRSALSSAGLWHQDKGVERELHSSPAVSNPSADDVLAKLAQSGVAQGKRPVSGGYPVRSTAKAEPAGSSSVCSTSAGSESGSSFTSSIRRSSSSGSVGAVRKTKSCPKARPKDVPKADAESSACTWGEERERRQRERGVVAPSPSTARQRSQSASSPAVTPRGASGATGSTRRASSGSPLRCSRPRGPPPSLYQAAEPLLSSATKEKRALALGAISRALKDGAPPDKWDGPETPLRAAVQARSAEMARLLVEARANPNETDAKGVCVLHTAAFDGLADLCRTLLQARADANAADQHGQTALFFSPLSSVCDVLLEHKANVNALNQKGQSALHLASRAGLTEVLVWMAPRVSRDVVDMRDTHGATAAYYARHAGIPSDFLVKHRLLVLESTPASSVERTRRRASRESELQETGRGRARQNWSGPSRAPLPTLLEDQQGSEEEAASASSKEELPCSTMVTPVDTGMAGDEATMDLTKDLQVQDHLESEEHGHAAEHGHAEDHGDCLERTMKAELHPEEVRQEHEETSSLFEETGHEKAEKVAEFEVRLSSEDRCSEASLLALPEAAGARVPLDLEVQGCEESRSSPPAGSCQMQACGDEGGDGSEHSPSYSASERDRADKMVTWEEDFGQPGSALSQTAPNCETHDPADDPAGTGNVPRFEPAAEAAGDEAAASSVASDTSESLMDASSPCKPRDGRSNRRERRVSMNQAFLWQFAEPER
ncbi:ANKRD36C [Symbiodinium sp. CCMP2592]|nr:ANKRD36C [Symbiodinium sp. CCMP2592]